MGHLRRTHIIAAIIGAILIVGFTLLGGTGTFGAHPFWATKVGYIGLAIGAGVFLVLALLGLGNRWLIGLSAIAVIAAWLSASQGKERFAASYAEDALAGRFWFIGWIALMAATFVLIAAVANTIQTRTR